VITIAKIFIYPIKACGGVALPFCDIVPGGLAGDRRYMLVDRNGRMVTRRERSELARVQLLIDENRFIARAPDMPFLALPTQMEDARAEFGETIASHVWSDTVLAPEHQRGSGWFSALLGEEIRLVYMPEGALRQVNPARSDPGDQVNFADGYPLLITSESSLDDLNARLSEPVPMERFRPNIVVTGAPAFEEDVWAEISLGEISCVLPKLCDRCTVTTVEEGSGHKGKEPLRTLATFRRWDKAVWFGTNAIPKSAGTVALGQEIYVRKRRLHPGGA